jgi:hypothetical protein
MLDWYYVRWWRAELFLLSIVQFGWSCCHSFFTHSLITSTCQVLCQTVRNAGFILLYCTGFILLFIGLSLYVVIASRELWQWSSMVLQSAEQHKNNMQQVSCSLEKHQDFQKSFRVLRSRFTGTFCRYHRSACNKFYFCIVCILLQLHIQLFVFTDLIEGKFKADVRVYMCNKILLYLFL